ncbi:cytochrome c oxidase subunit 2 [Mucilaginibacter frigoritolerans]|uniref:Cytochrome c oxidase subunit 2 n=1 Tax=Mucilaginibacter frigoritolerans TaxID=652788 RepID=A0A562U2K0_9SPHI|nr:cytochrome c oxidase subunit II [Mucilaginibacter frigoritolerans]TWJ00082.1 cytochrome c oxidase subunit 2 [Mucilaginibacter frigoritolerans]
MGFKKLINSKKIVTLLSMFLLLGTNMLMAQDVATAQGTSTATSPDSADKSGMWTSVGYYFLLFLVAGVCIVILGKILKVYDLTQKMQGKKGINWNNIMGFVCIIFLIAGLYGAVWSLTEQGSMTLPEAASVHGVDTDNMFTVTAILTLIVFFITQILLFGFAFVYRGSDKRKAYYLPHNNTIEKIWTIIPAAVLTVLVVFGFFTWQKIENSTEVKGDLNIDVTGHQFAWELRYPGKDGVLGSLDYKLTNANNKLGINFKDPKSLDDLQADTLVIPVNKSIRLNIHAQDVIHSVYMPHFRLQQNAVPGLPTFFKFIPTITTAEMRVRTDNPKFEYLLYCNKICGGIHYNMQKVVRVVTAEEYQDWIAKQRPYLTDKLRTELKLAANKSTSAPQAAANRLALNN